MAIQILRINQTDIGNSCTGNGACNNILDITYYTCPAGKRAKVVPLAVAGTRANTNANKTFNYYGTSLGLYAHTDWTDTSGGNTKELTITIGTEVYNTEDISSRVTDDQDCFIFEKDVVKNESNNSTITSTKSPFIDPNYLVAGESLGIYYRSYSNISNNANEITLIANFIIIEEDI